jgi:hypothetical protein
MEARDSGVPMSAWARYVLLEPVQKNLALPFSCC